MPMFVQSVIRLLWRTKRYTVVFSLQLKMIYVNDTSPPPLPVGVCSGGSIVAKLFLFSNNNILSIG